MIELEKYSKWLNRQDWSANTKRIYYAVVRDYAKQHNTVEAEVVHRWKTEQYKRYKPAGTNLRIRAMNVYLEFSHSRLRLRCVPAQQITRLDRVMSNADYRHLCTSLKADGELVWYIYIRLAATVGGRPSDLLLITAQDIYEGHKEILSKGKWRTIYIPRHVQREFVDLFGKSMSGNIWIRTDGKPFDRDYIRHQYKVWAKRYGLNPDLIYPYAFRHLYAQNFIKRCKNITLLADMLGHKNIQTTMIYTRLSLSEQKAEVNKIVQW